MSKNKTIDFESARDILDARRQNRLDLFAAAALPTITHEGGSPNTIAKRTWAIALAMLETEPKQI